MHDPISTPLTKGGLVPLRRPPTQPEPKRQIDIGDYVIFIGDMQVGEVYVEASAEHPDDAAYTVEHWCLYADYEAPGPDHQKVTLDLRYRELSPYENAAQFLQHVGKLAGARYVRASCQQLVP
jgi:hypothetical protein